MAEPQAIFSPSSVQVGDVVGSLLMLSVESTGRRKHWLVRCTDCGHERRVRSDHLERYAGTTCHCVPSTRHGHSRMREHRIWCKMIDRCHKPATNNYRFYGGCGHFVCDGWRESFDSFLADMGKAPSAGHSIDRIDTLGSYTCGHCDECKEKSQPANCRWATKYVQARNAKNNLWYTHDGQTLILKDWARVSGIPYLCLYRRINRGWSFADAITTPKLPSRAGRGNRHTA